MTIIIEDYEKSWPKIFEEEKNKLMAGRNPAFHSIEHIGSTAIPGLPAKPIIDMLGLLADRQFFEDSIPFIVSLGYEYLESFGLPGRYFFRKPGYNLHCYPQGHPEIERHLLFRDYLRAHATAREDYSALKKKLAKKYRDHQIAYTSGKTEFITDIERKAGHHGFKIVELLLEQEYEKANFFRKTKNLPALSASNKLASDTLIHLALYFRGAVIGYACVDTSTKIITEMFLDESSPPHSDKKFKNIIDFSLKSSYDLH